MRWALNLYDKTCATVKRRYEPISDSNWYGKSASALEGVRDALLREKPGASNRVIRVAMGKLGMAGTTVSIFSIASLFGTASTGTAIGSLSGAAFNSATLAWIGGSVLMGTILVSIASIVGGLIAILISGWLFTKFVWGRKRESADLKNEEGKIVEACAALAIAFRAQDNANKKLDVLSAKALHKDALKPLENSLLNSRGRTKDWPIGARKRLQKSIKRIQSLLEFLAGWTKQHPNLTSGLVSVVTIRLLSDDLSNFSEDEALVLDALRRSNNELERASEEQLAEYIQAMSPAQLVGLTNNVKGIYHELLFQRNENADSDQFLVEIFAATNHPGADVRIIDTLTGEVRAVQLKATDSLKYIEQHFDNYSAIPVFATEEVAAQLDYVSTTGIENEALKESVAGVFRSLQGEEFPVVFASMSTAALIALACNTGLFLRAQPADVQQVQKLARNSLLSAGIAGIVGLVV